jgi:hypothetical protein
VEPPETTPPDGPTAPQRAQGQGIDAGVTAETAILRREQHLDEMRRDVPHRGAQPPGAAQRGRTERVRASRSRISTPLAA